MQLDATNGARSSCDVRVRTERFCGGFRRRIGLHRRTRSSTSCAWKHKLTRPRLVVDLGSGTGLSTRVWADRADEVVGVEASPEMREQAERCDASGRTSASSRRTPRRRGSRTARRTSSPARRRSTGWSRSRRSPRRRGFSGRAASSPRTTTTGRRSSRPGGRGRVRGCSASASGRRARRTAERMRYAKEGHLERIQAERPVPLRARDRPPLP